MRDLEAAGYVERTAPETEGAESNSYRVRYDKPVPGLEARGRADPAPTPEPTEQADAQSQPGGILPPGADLPPGGISAPTRGDFAPGPGGTITPRTRRRTRRVEPEERERASARTHRAEGEPKATLLPEGWRPSPEDAARARSLGLDPEEMLEAFTDHWRANQNRPDARKADWNAAYRNWCRNELKFGKASRARRTAREERAADARFYAELSGMSLDRLAEFIPPEAPGFTLPGTVDGEVVQ
jgi:hypothetical protein